QQLRRAAVSSFLNLVEGSSRISTIERKRFYEIARSSVVEVDAALEIAHMQGYISSSDSDSLGAALIESFKYFSALINSTTIKTNK
ncbi:four helix bundle protein, partial [Klebsiella pneumoniae]|uniref:four helix bundle protein n=1 Tax=Klebsiella pneumoniae TaxID=573 RepID=UPI00200BF045